MRRVREGAALSLLLIAWSVASAASESDLRASYEVILSDGGGTYSTRTAETLRPGQPAAQELGSFRVELLPEVDHMGAYVLRVSVSRLERAATDVTPVESTSFPGVLGGPLEFSGRVGSVDVSGAIMLSELRGES